MNNNDHTLDIRGIQGKSTALNTQPGRGAQRPNMGQGKDNPGGTKPSKPEDKPAPLANGAR